jgi:O-succinylbenzoic acid--CoA ligase
MTETITHIALQNIHTGRDFESLPGIQLTLDNRGCLVIKAPYLKEPVVTNDLAELSSTHSFQWRGRIDGIINSGGVKIIPEQVEAVVDTALAKLNISRRFFVAGLPDERLGERVILFIEGNNLSIDDEEQIMSQVKEHLSAPSPHAIPKEIRYLPKFSETETGKIKVSETVMAYKNAN